MSDHTTSLQARLSLRLGTLFVLMFVAGMVMLSTRYRADSVELHAERLGNTIRTVAAGVARGADGRVSVTLPRDLTSRTMWSARRRGRSWPLRAPTRPRA